MKVMLTSCGLETEALKEHFLQLLGKPVSGASVLFIPTAAMNADAIAVLPKCMNDLLTCGIPKENIQVYDLHRNMHIDELQGYDAVYLCGGSTAYLLERINDSGFRDALLSYIENDGLVLGVSAGSMIFAGNLPGNLGLLSAKLNVHCKTSSQIGEVRFPLPETVELSNTAGILIGSIPDDVRIIDGETC